MSSAPSPLKTCSAVKHCAIPAFSRQTSTRSRGEPLATTCRRPAAWSASTVFAFSYSSRARKRSAELAIWEASPSASFTSLYACEASE